MNAHRKSFSNGFHPITALGEKLDTRHVRIRRDGKYMWKIKNFSALKARQRQGETNDQKSIMSPEHFHTREGYEFKLRLFCNGAGSGSDQYISLYLQMRPTQYDDILTYPFIGVISFTLLDQRNTDKKRNHEMKFRSNQSASFARPEPDTPNPERGIAQFYPFDKLLKKSGEDEPLYLNNDIIYIQAEILRNTSTTGLEGSAPKK